MEMHCFKHCLLWIIRPYLIIHPKKGLNDLLVGVFIATLYIFSREPSIESLSSEIFILIFDRVNQIKKES